MNKEFQQFYELMQRELKLQGKAKATQDGYLRTLRRVEERIDKELDQLTPEDLKTYFADLLETHSWSTVKVDRCALVFFYTFVLDRDWQWIKIVKVPRVKTIPDILTVEETVYVLSQLEKPRYKACLTAIYSMGLRLSEGLQIRPGDICSATMRMHVRNSKGRKDRLVPLPHVTLNILRQHWLTHRNPHRLFPRFHGTSNKISKTKLYMDKGGVQNALKAALADANIHKKISVHSLRHSYATHLVEIGVNLRMVQEILGHSSPVSTAIYAQISKPVSQDSDRMINQMMQKLSSLL